MAIKHGALRGGWGHLGPLAAGVVRDHRGATTLEVALIFMLALLLVFGVMQVALIATVHAVVSYGAYIGARSSAVGYADPGLAVAQSLGRVFPGNSPPVTRAAGGAAEATQDMALLFPFVRTFLGERWRLAASVTLPTEPALCDCDN